MPTYMDIHDIPGVKAADVVHREAHGLEAHTLHEVSQGA